MFSSGKSIADSEIEAYQKKTLDPNFKGAVLGSMDEVLSSNKQHFKKYSFRVLNEYLFTSQACWAFPKSSFLINTFDRRLERFAENGMIDFLTTKYMDPRYLKAKETKQGPRKINLDQLLGSFEILIFGNGLAFAVLAMEIVAQKFEVKIMKKMFDLLM